MGLELPGELTSSTLHTSELVLKMFLGTGDIAQWGKRLPDMQEAVGSILSTI